MKYIVCPQCKTLQPVTDDPGLIAQLFHPEAVGAVKEHEPCGFAYISRDGSVHKAFPDRVVLQGVSHE